jgi:hypothetical protein
VVWPWRRSDGFFRIIFLSVVAAVALPFDALVVETVDQQGSARNAQALTILAAENP